ncbi:MAG TPA: hypothetical protein DSN98_03810 [Thermoplasmata archaeon]|jgi:hypothetical protein|nr:MAG TPA: hypothetical protein DSN98_03810 [Thermoplasmata archaeon]
MVKIKGILAIGIIILFLGLAFSPATAQTAVKDQSNVTTIGEIAPVQLTGKDIATMEKIMPALLEKMSTATSYSELKQIVQSSVNEYGRMLGVVLLLKLVIKAIDFNFKFNEFRPIRRNAFVMSWGFTNKLLSLGKNKINLLRPITGWYYSGKSNLILNSRTLIIDPYPFSVKMLTGRQIGLMSDFKGLYIHRSGNIANKAITFFFGFADTIRGFDLSPMKK